MGEGNLVQINLSEVMFSLETCLALSKRELKIMAQARQEFISLKRDQR